MGTWGNLRDGRTELAREARLIERELVQTHAPGTPGERRRVRSAARYLAVVEMTLAQAKMNGDLRSVRRTIVGLQAAADRQLAGLEALSHRTPTLAEAIRQRRAGGGA